MKEAVEQITHWADRFDCMVIGPGLGRDELVHDTVKQVGCLFFGLSSIGRNRSGKQIATSCILKSSASPSLQNQATVMYAVRSRIYSFLLAWLQVIKYLREKRKPVVIDADGLYITTKNLDLVKGYDLAILTPNKNEFLRLAKQMDIPLEGEGAPEDPLMEITKRLEGPIVLRKGSQDSACNGTVTISNGEGGSKRRSGGQVDILLNKVLVLFSICVERNQHDKHVRFHFEKVAGS